MGSLRMDSNRRAFRCYDVKYRCGIILVRTRKIMSLNFRCACCTRECFVRAGGFSGEVEAIERGIVSCYFSSSTSFNETLCVYFNRRLSIFCVRLTSFRVVRSCSAGKKQVIVVAVSGLSKEECVEASS